MLSNSFTVITDSHLNDLGFSGILATISWIFITYFWHWIYPLPIQWKFCLIWVIAI